MIGVFIGVGVNVVMQNVMGTVPGTDYELIQKGDNSLVVLTSGIFPTARWGAEAMIHYGEPSGLFSILLYVGLSVLIYLILLWLGQLIYLRGVMGLSETGSKRNKSNGLDLEKEVVKGSIIRTYTLVELKLLFRTPIYFINCVMINFLWPVFIILPLIFQPAEANMIHELSKILNKPGTEGNDSGRIPCCCIILSATNGTASTSISREGQQLFVKKYLLVSYRQQLNAKILSGFILGFVSVLIMFLFAVFMFKLPLWLGLFILSAAWLPVPVYQPYRAVN